MHGKNWTVITEFSNRTEISKNCVLLCTFSMAFERIQFFKKNIILR